MADSELPIVIDLTSAVPPFEQLRAQLASLVASGELLPGAKLPTVRQLASDLGLAANTVARSYRELEADAVLVTEGRRGTFVHSRPVSGEAAPRLDQLVTDFVTAARRAGLSAPEALRLVEHAWRST
jgi:DNA-binding transcriptional regulator YhcF (GntR family)